MRAEAFLDPGKAQLRDLAGKLWPENRGAFQIGGHTRGIGALATDHMYHTPEVEMAERNPIGRGS